MSRTAGAAPTVEILGKTVKPHISLWEVASLSLVLSDGTWNPVISMSAEEFLDAMEVLIKPLSCEARYHARKFMYDLDYRLVIEGISYERWYALDELLRLGVKLPVQRSDVA